jgi:hypothetical protein
MMKRVETSYASDVTTADKERLQAAYAKFRVRLQERRVARGDIDRLRAILSSKAMGSFSRDEVRDMTQLFEGMPPPPVPPAPAATTPSPTPRIPRTP